MSDTNFDYTTHPFLQNAENPGFWPYAVTIAHGINRYFRLRRDRHALDLKAFIIGDACFRAAAKACSTADTRRIAARQHGNRSVVSLIAFLLWLEGKSPAMSPTAEVSRAQRADGRLAHRRLLS